MKSILSDGIPQAFLPLRFVDIIVITVHDRFWNVGQANCILNKGNNKLPNSEQSNKGKVKTHKYINRKNQPTTRKL